MNSERTPLLINEPVCKYPFSQTALFRVLKVLTSSHIPTQCKIERWAYLAFFFLTRDNDFSGDPDGWFLVEKIVRSETDAPGRDNCLFNAPKFNSMYSVGVKSFNEL